jgi:hypothetical protein
MKYNDMLRRIHFFNLAVIMYYYFESIVQPVFNFVTNVSLIQNAQNCYTQILKQNVKSLLLHTVDILIAEYKQLAIFS